MAAGHGVALVSASTADSIVGNNRAAPICCVSPVRSSMERSGPFAAAIDFFRNQLEQYSDDLHDDLVKRENR